MRLSSPGPVGRWRDVLGGGECPMEETTSGFAESSCEILREVQRVMPTRRTTVTQGRGSR